MSGMCLGLVRLIGIVACSASVAANAAAGDAPRPAAQIRLGATPPNGGAGITVYVDPNTGKVVEPPAPGAQPLQLTPQELNMRSSSSEGLTEVPSTAPDGGYMVDLQGRFQSPMMGTIDANGKARTQHLEVPASPGQTR